MVRQHMGFLCDNSSDGMFPKSLGMIANSGLKVGPTD